MSYFEIKNETLILGNDLFSFTFSDVTKADAKTDDANGLSLPYLDITAEGAERTRHYHVWDNLPLVYMPDYGEKTLLNLKGKHWIVRAIKLHAFTDLNDTLTTENEYYLFNDLIHQDVTGNIFILEDPVSGDAFVIISETPDYKSAKLTISNNVVAVENGTDALALGFCKVGEGEALCRAYYRHAKAPGELVTMSNTWGDRNGNARVCHDFMLREVDAAKEIGVDIVQIDDGWQVGRPATTIRDEKGRRYFPDGFWELQNDRFPEGIGVVTKYAAKDGIKVGLWFSPDLHDNYAKLDRDLGILKYAYDEWGIRFFKLDMYFIETDAERDRFLEFLQGIYSFGNDVSVQLDTTRDLRLNYYCGRQYGTLFIENRYHASANSFPHRVLRNLWSLGKFLPTQKFQFELINPDLYTEAYEQDDPLVPSLFDMDYLFATVMLCNPLFWMEMQFLSDARRAELAKIMPVWKAYRAELSTADVLPIGQKPSGRSFSGFSVQVDGKAKYLLLFREVTEQDHAVIAAPVEAGKVEILASNADADVTLENGSVTMRISKPRGYVFARIL